MDTLLLSWPSLLPPAGSVCRSASSCLYSNKLQFGSPWRTTKPRSVDTISKLTVRCGGGSSIRAINESEFQSAVLESDRPVLVEFVATWCGPCRLISPAMESISQEYGDKLTIIKVDHDANPRLIQEYKVYGLPTLILFNNGNQVLESRREGAITKVKLKQYIDTLLEMISVL